MSVYFIGDVHACFHELQDLLNVMEFNPNDDELVLTGDIIGRGPHPLETIEYVRSLGDRAHMVLGNHDLNLLAVIFGHNQPKNRVTPGKIIAIIVTFYFIMIFMSMIFALIFSFG